VFFVEPLWLCVLIPILLAPIPVAASLALRRRRAPAFEASFLAASGFAIAVVLGGALFAAIVAGFVLFTHRVALSVAALVDGLSQDVPSNRSRARVTLTTAVSSQVKPAVSPSVLYTQLSGVLSTESPGIRAEVLTIAVIVSERGRVLSVKAVNAPRNVGESIVLLGALASIKSAQFRPAIRDGIPVKYPLLVPIR